MCVCVYRIVDWLRWRFLGFTSRGSPQITDLRQRLADSQKAVLELEAEREQRQRDYDKKLLLAKSKIENVQVRNTVCGCVCVRVCGCAPNMTLPWSLTCLDRAQRVCFGLVIVTWINQRAVMVSGLNPAPVLPPALICCDREACFLAAHSSLWIPGWCQAASSP